MALLILPPACEKYAPRFYRSEVMGRGNARPEQPLEHVPRFDTLVYVSAVVVPDSYDWRRDTSFGSASCKLVLMKDGTPLFSLSTGMKERISIEPDTHHILDGHLYTEYSTSSETFLKRDGELVCSFPGREVLKGLLVREDGVYTLGQDREGGGFTFRHNGNEVLRVEDGTVFGDFNSSAYGRTGALYELDGDVCFCYRDEESCHAVRNGDARPENSGVSPSRVKDLRLASDGLWSVSDYGTLMMVDGPYRSYALSRNYSWTACELWPGSSGMWVLGETAASGLSCTMLRPVHDDTGEFPEIVFRGGNNYVYGSGESACFAISGDKGGLKVQDAEGHYIYGRDSAFFFTRDCAMGLGEALFMAVTPRERRFPPFLWKNGEEELFAINGYLTGVEAVLSPAR
ncbi:MAG: hypothetical protein IJ222_02660 [Bacteroidales bacterium]|nr:hypothetical protein [Bacteroidales bacterium]